MNTKYVTSLELSKQLKEAGIPQESYFYWSKQDDGVTWRLVNREFFAVDKRKDISAFHLSDVFWLPIKGYEGLYEVSNWGQVRRNGKVLSIDWSNRGYGAVELSKNNIGKRHQIHRLVAETFLPRKDGQDYVNHIDFNPKNNWMGNLEWCTQSENNQHSIDNGRYPTRKGENHPMSKLTESEVKVIKARISQGDKLTYIAEDFGVSVQHISDIKLGKKWGNI